MLLSWWERGKPAAFDITVVSPRTAILGEASHGSSSLRQKHTQQKMPCKSWVVPIWWRFMATGTKWLGTRFGILSGHLFLSIPRSYQTSVGV